MVHSYIALKASDNGYAAIRLRGEAWTGKSRILDEFLSVAAHRNHVLGGSCSVSRRHTCLTRIGGLGERVRGRSRGHI